MIYMVSYLSYSIGKTSFVLYVVCPTDRGKHNLSYTSFVINTYVISSKLISEILFGGFSIFKINF